MAQSDALQNERQESSAEVWMEGDQTRKAHVSVIECQISVGSEGGDQPGTRRD
jgi:hypothetical protein